VAANLVTDIIPPATLINYVRQYDIEVLRPDSQFTLDRWLPNVTVEEIDFRIRKGALNDVDTAEYRAWDTPAAMTGRPGVTRISGSLGPVSRQIPLGEEEFLRVRQLLTNSADPIIDAIYADAERMIRSVQARVELARGDIINDGKFTIAENGLVLEADFGRSGTHSVTAGTLWTNPASTILADLLAWTTTYVNDNGAMPGYLLMPRARLANMALNTEMRQYAALNGTTPTRINAETIAAILGAEGLPPIEIYDTQVRVNGARTRVLPANKVFLMPSEGEPLGNTFFGITAEALLLASRGLIAASEAPGIVAVVTQTEHPVQTYTVGTAIASPVMPNPDLVLDAVVA
jgi:hypothetical protein